MRSLLLLCIALLWAPMQAYAYATPEEVLFPEEAANEGATLFPIHRDSGDAVAQQQQRAKERREREWAAAYNAQHPPSSSSSLGEAQSSSSAASDAAAAQSTDEPDKNAEENEDTSMTIQPWENATGGSQEVLHSGAPLAPTGPGSWLAFGVLFVTIGYTMWRVRSGFTIGK